MPASLNKFVVKHCANYHNGNECLDRQYRPCLVLGGKRCQYFETSVLGPPDYGFRLPGVNYRDLFGEYQTRTGQSVVGVKQRLCGCGEPLPKRHRVCAQCRQKNRRRTYRNSKKSQRLGVHS